MQLFTNKKMKKHVSVSLGSIPVTCQLLGEKNSSNWALSTQAFALRKELRSV
jgi:hypothetical protein